MIITTPNHVKKLSLYIEPEHAASESLSLLDIFMNQEKINLINNCLVLYYITIVFKYSSNKIS